MNEEHVLDGIGMKYYTLPDYGSNILNEGFFNAGRFSTGVSIYGRRKVLRLAFESKELKIDFDFQYDGSKLLPIYFTCLDKLNKDIVFALTSPAELD